jgi:hypothetical protein
MTRRPTVPLTPSERAAVGMWTRCTLGVLSLSLLGPDRRQAPLADCSELACLRQVTQTGTGR